MKKFYEDNKTILYKGNCLRVLKKLPEKSVDMIFADPPYFLSNNGVSCKSGKQVSVNKAKWDTGKNFNQVYLFNKHWIKECKRVLKDTGTIWVTGTFHNIYSVGFALQQQNFRILNNITWQKTNPPPNLGCRCFTNSTETILWAKKDLKKAKHYFDYPLMKQFNGGKQMKDVWTGSTTKKSEKSFGPHPTQKPLYILERIILASTDKGDVVLDCFLGSGTTGVVSRKLERSFIGIDKEEQYLALALRRILNEEKEKI